MKNNESDELYNSIDVKNQGQTNESLSSHRSDRQKSQLLLDRPLTAENAGPVRIIVLFEEPTDESEEDPDDTTVEEVKASLRRALQQAKTGQTRPISELWEGIDVE